MTLRDRVARPSDRSDPAPDRRECARDFNDYDVRIVKLQGDFTWHKHDDTDELFLVLSGELTIQMRDRDVVLGPRELFVVPRGAEHCPRPPHHPTPLRADAGDPAGPGLPVAA